MPTRTNQYADSEQRDFKYANFLPRIRVFFKDIHTHVLYNSFLTMYRATQQ